MSELDTKLKQKVDHILSNNPETRDLAIDTRNNNSVIFLMGTVETKAQLEIAESIVREIDGVAGVVNELDITPFEKDE